MSKRDTSQRRWSALGEQAQREAALLDPTLPVRVVQPLGSPRTSQSYYDTRWPLLNRALAVADRRTHGRAGLLQRLFTYLAIGGTAAIVNLSILAFLFTFGSASNPWYWVLANAVAYELALMVNFIPNDYITFRHLAGHERSWLLRCLRFHVTCISGALITFGLSALLFHLLGLPALLAQAIALIIATFYNFTVHHLFTYAQKHA